MEGEINIAAARSSCLRSIQSLVLLLALGALGSFAAFANAAQAAPGSQNGGAPITKSPPTQTPPPRPAATPPMGWDSWDSFGCGINQQDVEKTANWLVATGLRNAGYRYVIIDDCWYAPTRSADGSLRPDTSKFPNGMRWLSWYLHSRGLLFGIYASASQSTCAQENNIYPGSTGSLGHEQQDARTFASWHVDYVKYDWCSPDGTVWQQIAGFRTMLDALRATHRHIVFSINPNSFHTTTGAQWNWSAISNLVRMAPDLAPVWDMGPQDNWYSGVLNAILEDAGLWGRAGSGHWNDPDALVVGMRAAQYAAAVQSPSFANLVNSPPPGVDVNLTYEDMRTNFAMWSMLAAPLIIGADVPYLGPAARSILLNPWFLSIDQDPLGKQARPIDNTREVWFKPLSGGAEAVALLNPTNATITLSTNARRVKLPAAKRYMVRNAWTGAMSSTKGLLEAVVPAHGVAVFIVAPIVVSKRSTTKAQSPSTPGRPGSGSAAAPQS